MAISLEISARTPGMDAATADVDRLAKELAEAQRQAAGFGKETALSGKELKGYRKPAEQAAKATDKTSKAMGKGATQARAFGSALTSAKGALAATVAAVGAKELLAFAEAGAKLQVTTRNLQEIGVSLDQTKEIAGRLGGGSIAQVEQLISRVDAMGVSFDNMGGLADAALRISIERGEDSHVIFNKLIRAIATGKQTYLQQLGITLNLKQAWDDYAKSIGKSRSELTEQEKATVSSKLAIQELNDAFGGRSPDKYASSIGEVRDTFNNLADSIKRLAGDALADLGAVIGWLKNGGEIGFASDPVTKRSTQIQKSIDEMEQSIARLESASKRGVSEVAETVLDMQERMGGDAFTAMMGLPSDTEITRLTAAYIGAQERVQTQLATARKRLQAQIELDEAEEDYQASLKAEQVRQRALEEARERARERAKRAAKAARERARREAEQAERDRLEGLARLRAAYFDRRAAQEFEQEEEARERLLASIEADARSAADAARLALQSIAGESGFDAIEARYQIQKDAAITAAQAEIQIAQTKGESIEQIERDLQYNLLTLEQERLEASKSLTERYIRDTQGLVSDVIARRVREQPLRR